MKFQFCREMASTGVCTKMSKVLVGDVGCSKRQGKGRKRKGRGPEAEQGDDAERYREHGGLKR